jgi:multiple antibiotic resistance protein
MIKNLLLAFIPIFVAVDAIGVLPIFISFTHGLKKQEKSKVILQSMVTALGLAVGFIFLGKAIFSFPGITVSDFMIAGRVVLFSIAIIDIVSLQKNRRAGSRSGSGCLSTKQGGCSQGKENPPSFTGGLPEKLPIGRK